MLEMKSLAPESAMVGFLDIHECAHEDTTIVGLAFSKVLGTPVAGGRGGEHPPAIIASSHRTSRMDGLGAKLLLESAQSGGFRVMNTGEVSAMMFSGTDWK